MSITFAISLTHCGRTTTRIAQTKRVFANTRHGIFDQRGEWIAVFLLYTMSIHQNRVSLRSQTLSSSASWKESLERATISKQSLPALASGSDDTGRCRNAALKRRRCRMNRQSEKKVIQAILCICSLPLCQNSCFVLQHSQSQAQVFLLFLISLLIFIRKNCPSISASTFVTLSIKKLMS